MERRNTVFGFIVLGVVALVIFFLFKNQKSDVAQITSLPSPSSEEKLENRFNLEIPDEVDKAELVSSSTDTSGVATRNYEAGLFSVTLLTDLPDSEQPYQAWLINDSNNEFVWMGELSIAKGGYILNFDISRDLNSYKKVTVTSGKSASPIGQTTVLQGVFK